MVSKLPLSCISTHFNQFLLYAFTCTFWRQEGLLCNAKFGLRSAAYTSFPVSTKRLPQRLCCTRHAPPIARKEKRTSGGQRGNYTLWLISFWSMNAKIWSIYLQAFNSELLLIVARRLSTMRSRARGRWEILLIIRQATTTKVSLSTGPFFSS